MKFALIGLGNMGSAIYQGLVKIIPVGDIFVCDRNSRAAIANLSADANRTIAQADVVILAVKPQQFEALAAELERKMLDKLVISIMAGVSIGKIQKLTGARRVIRSMPNLAAAVGESLSGWIASDSATVADKKLAAKIFSSFGEQLELRNEDMINALTALSGSGPAYFFYLTEALQKKALAYGFSSEEAQLIANKTLLGSARLINSQDLADPNLKSAADWRKTVTSKGGTTEAALEYMEGHGLADIMDAAMDKAKARALELNG